MLKKHTHSIMGLWQMTGLTKLSGSSTQLRNRSLGENKNPAKATAVIIPGMIDALGKSGVLPISVNVVTMIMVTNPIPKKLKATVT